MSYLESDFMNSSAALVSGLVIGVAYLDPSVRLGGTTTRTMGESWHPREDYHIPNRVPAHRSSPRFNRRTVHTTVTRVPQTNRQY